MGDVVRVKDGYARNFLLPRGKALRATQANLARFETERAQLEARNLELKKEADDIRGRLDGSAFVIIRQAGESGQLYGSVSSRDIATALTDGGFSVARSQAVLDRPIKTLGLYDVRITLHPEVTATVTLNVARTAEEAERQAAGEDVTARVDEEEEAIAVEEVFESEELARDAVAEAQTGDGDAASQSESPEEEPSN